MKDVLERAKSAVRNNYPSPHLALLTELVDELESTRAQRDSWRSECTCLRILNGELP